MITVTFCCSHMISDRVVVRKKRLRTGGSQSHEQSNYISGGVLQKIPQFKERSQEKKKHNWQQIKLKANFITVNSQKGMRLPFNLVLTFKPLSFLIPEQLSLSSLRRFYSNNLKLLILLKIFHVIMNCWKDLKHKLFFFLSLKQYVITFVLCQHKVKILLK